MTKTIDPVQSVAMQGAMHEAKKAHASLYRQRIATNIRGMSGSGRSTLVRLTRIQKDHPNAKRP